MLVGKDNDCSWTTESLLEGSSAVPIPLLVLPFVFRRGEGSVMSWFEDKSVFCYIAAARYWDLWGELEFTPAILRI